MSKRYSTSLVRRTRRNASPFFKILTYFRERITSINERCGGLSSIEIRIDELK